MLSPTHGRAITDQGLWVESSEAWSLAVAWICTYLGSSIPTSVKFPRRKLWWSACVCCSVLCCIEENLAGLVCRDLHVCPVFFVIVHSVEGICMCSLSQGFQHVVLDDAVIRSQDFVDQLQAHFANISFANIFR